MWRYRKLRMRYMRCIENWLCIWFVNRWMMEVKAECCHFKVSVGIAGRNGTSEISKQLWATLNFVTSYLFFLSLNMCCIQCLLRLNMTLSCFVEVANWLSANSMLSFPVFVITVHQRDAKLQHSHCLYPRELLSSPRRCFSFVEKLPQCRDQISVHNKNVK